MVFRIGIGNDSFDISNNIVVGTYEVNLVDKYNSWTDATKTEHRDYLGSKAEGKCSLFFSSNEDYLNFLDLLRINRDSQGFYVCEITVNNSAYSHRGNFYLDFAPAMVDSATGGEKIGSFELKIVER